MLYVPGTWYYIVMLDPRFLPRYICRLWAVVVSVSSSPRCNVTTALMTFPSSAAAIVAAFAVAIAVAVAAASAAANYVAAASISVAAAAVCVLFSFLFVGGRVPYSGYGVVAVKMLGMNTQAIGFVFGEIS